MHLGLRFASLSTREVFRRGLVLKLTSAPSHLWWRNPFSPKRCVSVLLSFSYRQQSRAFLFFLPPDTAYNAFYEHASKEKRATARPWGTTDVVDDDPCCRSVEN